MGTQIGIIGYSIAAFACSALTGLVVTAWRVRTRGSLFSLVCVVSAAWAIVLAIATGRSAATGAAVFFAETLFAGAWLLFLSSLLGGAVAKSQNWLVQRGGVLVAATLLGAGFLLVVSGMSQQYPQVLAWLLETGTVALSLFALLGVEQLFRNARLQQQNGLKFFCLGLAFVFAFNLLLYTTRLLGSTVGDSLWDARGYVVALCMPLLGISIQRTRSWGRGFFASRQVVYFTATLLVAGIYLVVVGAVSYFINNLHQSWSEALLIVFLSAAVLFLLALVQSEQLRARGKVWLTKHFFEQKFDYREQWLRLIDTLTSTASDLPLKKRAIKSLAEVVESPAGHLWLAGDAAESFQVAANWNTPGSDRALDSAAALPPFLKRTGWVIDRAEVAARPDRYAALSGDDLEALGPEAHFVVPLIHEQDLVGFVTLSAPKTPQTLNFEDHDLLKTAGKQIASYLAQEEASERLSENRQFEAYNRFAAFVMHDLKNAIAQQTLIVENAEKHKRNPEFVDDAMAALTGSVARLRRVMDSLQQGANAQYSERIDATRLLQQVVAHCSTWKPKPHAVLPGTPVFVRANRERLLLALIHVLRNAQDATQDDGTVTVTLEVSASNCRVLVADNGCGMDADFVRNRLFRPFDSTKGAEGMGIGAHQVRETLRACGGDTQVESSPGVGTTITLRIPLIKEETE